MRLKQLLASVIGVTGVCLATMPVKAARLQTWQFDPGQNRLTFTTEAGVQPQARLLTRPYRLVIDLPGIAYDQPSAQELVGGAVQAVRVRRYGAETTRLELTLSPDYTIRPEDIRVWGVTPQQWVIQLPDRSGVIQHLSPFPPSLKPQRSAAQEPPGEPQLPSLSAVAAGPDKNYRYEIPAPLDQEGDVGEVAAAQKQNSAYQPAATHLQRIVATPEGFFLQTVGVNPPVQVYHTRNGYGGTEIVIDLLNTVAPPGITTSLPPGHLGAAWSATQYATVPPAIRLTLSLAPNSPQWQVSSLGQGGIAVLPVAAQAAPVVSFGISAGASASSGANSRGPQLPQIAQPVAAVTQPAMTRLAQERVTVVLDPGHGGVDPGAVGIGGLQEKRVVMAITQHTAAALEAAGVNVVLTRRGDESVDLQPRVDLAEAAQANLFVSIHANAVAGARAEVNGIETYYYSDRGERFAQILHRAVMQRINLGDRGVKQARFFVIRRTSMPAVLIETGFVTGAVDAPYLRDPGWQVTMGEAIAAGILTYIQQH